MRKAFRVLVTEKCNMHCKTCFNKDVRRDKEISLDDFTLLCEWLSKEGEIKRLKIMGGEPTVHTHFFDIVEIAKYYFPCICIFTNAVNNLISEIILRKEDMVIFNLSCLPSRPNKKKFLIDQECGHIFEVRIDSESDPDKLCYKLDYIHKLLGDNLLINLTLNCVEDIFVYKPLIVRNWKRVVSYCKDHLHIDFMVDHPAPLCFINDSIFFPKNITPICSSHCAGLITPDLNLRYCNQVSKDIIALKRNNAFIPYNEVETILLNFHQDHIRNNHENFCKDCTYFPTYCNGSCFAHRFN